MDNDERLLTTGEVAEALRCTPRTVHRLAAAGRLQPIQFAPLGRLRFAAAEVAALIESSRKPRGRVAA
jgi:excisionase family DNA binding protein